MVINYMHGMIKNKKNLRSLVSKAGAQASVEFVLIIPLIILIILAVSHLGMLVYQKNVLEQAAREGARVVATTNSNEKALVCIRNFCSGFSQDKLDIEIIPAGSSSRKAGDMVEVVISYKTGGFPSILECFRVGDGLIRTRSNMRMECY